MTDQLLRRYVFKLYPNAGQAAALERQRRMHCDLWNALLQQREEAYRRQGKSLTYYDQCKELTALRAADPEYTALSFESMAMTARRLDRAFQAFFRRAKQGAGVSAGYPKFQSGRRYGGFGFKKHGSGWKITLDGGRPKGRLYVKGVPGTIRLRGCLPATPLADFRSADLTWDGEAWWISIVAVMAPRRAAEPETIKVDLDVERGEVRVKRPDGEYVAALFPERERRNQWPFQRLEQEGPAEAVETGTDRRGTSGASWVMLPAEAVETGTDRRRHLGTIALAVSAEAVETAKRRGRKWRRREGWRKAHEMRARREYHHRLTTILAEADCIHLTMPRDLAAAGRSTRGTAQDPGALVDIKATFNRRLREQAPALFRQMLEYKVAEAGGRLHVEETEIELASTITAVATAKKRARKAVKIAKGLAT